MISVVIPCFNSDFIEEAVDSILAQTFQDFEILVVDCSSDSKCADKVSNLKHPKIKTFRREGRHLPGDNRNFGVERAQGEFIVCIDADDLIVPTFLEEGLFVITCMNYSLIGTGVRMFGAFERCAKLLAHPTPELILKGDSAVVTWLMRRQLWCDLGGQRDTGLGPEHVPEDWDFLIRAIANGATLYNRGSYGLLYRKYVGTVTAHPDLMEIEVAFNILRDRYPEYFKTPISQPPQPPVTEDGWKQLVHGIAKQRAGIVFLPEQINDAFVAMLMGNLADFEAPLVVLSTCQMETYPPDFLSSLTARGAITFSFPDFLESKEMWLQFLTYLNESRQIEHVWYGQNGYFLNNLDSISGVFSGSTLHYIPRYANAATVAR